MTDLAEAPPVEEVHDPTSGVGALVRLVLVMIGIVAAFVLFGGTDLLIVIVALIAMVLLHELGHFATAKWSGMKVTEYFVGFGPRLWSFRRGETEYGVKAIPAGGYVRIIGMTSVDEVHPTDEPRAYRNQPFPQRIAVASAGSAMHFLIAFVLAFVALSFIGRPDPSVIQVQGLLRLSGTQSPALHAGIQPGDQIVSIDGKPVTSDASLSSVIHHHVGQPVAVTIKHDGVERTVEVTPIDGRGVYANGAPLAPRSGPPVGYIGVELTEGTSTVGPLGAVADSASLVRQATTASIVGLGHLFSPSGLANYAHQVVHPAPASSSGSSASSSSSSSSQSAAPRPESIIGAVRTATQATEAGILPLLEVLISINIFIGIINMLPMLPLDGGHVAIAAYEWARTRRGRPMYRADITKLMPAVYLFVGFLLLLVSTSVYLDLTHPAANPFR